jgi:hypothetical protein
MPKLSRITQFTLRWLEGGDKKALIEYMDSVGNSQAQIGHWLGYAAEMSALEDESLESVIETEAILARMQRRIK